MSKVNFVPEDYVQKKEARRANIMYIALFMVMMGVLGSTFAIIKMRQHAVQENEEAIDAKLQQASEEIRQLEVLQAKRKEMLKTALTTAELIEPVPRSVILAALTNSLPDAVSLTKLKMQQKESFVYNSNGSKYQNAKGGASKASTTEYVLDIEGISPSDIEVASYLANISSSVIFDKVELTQSKELKVDDYSYRNFKLKAKIKGDYSVSQDDIERIEKGESLSMNM